MRNDDAQLYLVTGAAAAVGLAALWLTGALAGAVFGSGWTSTRLGDLPVTAARLPLHLGDPRSAWPREARAALPGPTAFYLIATLVLIAFVAVALAGVRTAERLGVTEMPGGRRKPPSAKAASRRDLRPLRVPSPGAGRITLGHSKGLLLAAEKRQSVIVFAPTETHKTSALVIPALLEWEGPVLVTSVKNDLIAPTLTRREGLGEVMIFDPTQATGMPRSRATPLWGATSWRGAMRVAEWLSSAARLGHNSGLQDADFWSATGQKLLGPLLFAAAANGRTVETVVRWLDEGPEESEDEVAELLEATGVAEATRAWRATQNREERQRSSIYTTAEMAMAAFADPRVVEETAGADYSPAALLDGRANTLYICAPRSEQKRLRPLFSMLVQELVAVAEQLYATTGKPLDPPLLLLLDECANIAPIPDLDKVAATGAGQGIQLLSVFHDLAQLASLYGRSSSTVVNNHAAKIAGAGISDPETGKYFSSLIGAGKFDQRSRTAGERGRTSTTEGEAFRDLAPPSVVRETKPGTGLLVYKHIPHTKISLRPWFEERTLRRLQQASPGVSEAKEV